MINVKFPRLNVIGKINSKLFLKGMEGQSKEEYEYLYSAFLQQVIRIAFYKLQSAAAKSD